MLWRTSIAKISSAYAGQADYGERGNDEVGGRTGKFCGEDARSPEIENHFTSPACTTMETFTSHPCAFRHKRRLVSDSSRRGYFDGATDLGNCNVKEFVDSLTRQAQ